MFRLSFYLALFFLFPPLLSALPSDLTKLEKEKARQHYRQQRLLLSPDNLKGYVDLGKFCEENGLYDEAIELYKKVLVMPDITLDSRQNVAKLIEVTEENAAITLYNQAVLAWQNDHNFSQAQYWLDILLVKYPTAQIVSKSREFQEDLKKEEIREKELMAFRKNLKKSESENFIVYASDEALAARVNANLEIERKQIIQKFGFLVFSSWKKAKAKVYIFPERGSFLKYAFSQDWSGAWTWQVLREDAQGDKQVTQRAIYTFETIPGLETSVLPHELTHLVFREFFGFSPNIPKWMDEGVAIWMEKDDPAELNQVIQAAAKQNKCIPLKVYFYIQDYPQNPTLFYAEAQSLVRFLINRYGVGDFINLVKLLSSEKTIEPAILEVYSKEILDIEDLDEIWKESLL